MLSEMISEHRGIHIKCNSVENQLKCLVNCTQTHAHIVHIDTYMCASCVSVCVLFCFP